ncbi:hypothetical protein [Nonomuraea dietziae]|uniref:hypothetical protein n=1 Tax=Nonomuraea dietziae TaxID=65515 RepID=UPI00340F330F
MTGRRRGRGSAAASRSGHERGRPRRRGGGGAGGAFLPQFIDPRLGQVWLQFAILGAILILLEFVVDGTVGVLAGRIGGWLRRRHAVRRRVDVATGGLFIGLGVRLAVDR